MTVPIASKKQWSKKEEKKQVNRSKWLFDTFESYSVYFSVVVSIVDVYLHRNWDTATIDITSIYFSWFKLILLRDDMARIRKHGNRFIERTLNTMSELSFICRPKRRTKKCRCHSRTSPAKQWIRIECRVVRWKWLTYMTSSADGFQLSELSQWWAYCRWRVRNVRRKQRLGNGIRRFECHHPFVTFVLTS